MGPGEIPQITPPTLRGEFESSPSNRWVLCVHAYPPAWMLFQRCCRTQIHLAKAPQDAREGSSHLRGFSLSLQDKGISCGKAALDLPTQL